MRHGRVIATWLFFMALLAAGLIFVSKPQTKTITPSQTGEVEYCLTCHADILPISKSHPTDIFGCWGCHGGERLSLSADLAHNTMRAGNNPSNLDSVEQSCGGESCHSGSAGAQRDHIQRVKMSIQGTYAGAIAMLRFSFGAQSDLNAQKGIYAVANPNYRSGSPGVPSLDAFDPATEENATLKKFAENCLYCHLTADPAQETIFQIQPSDQEKTAANREHPGPDTFSRMKGCSACHTIGSPEHSDRPVHQLTTAIPYTQCNTCHNRGNYDLRKMVFVARGDQPESRLEDYYQPIAQFVRCEWTLDCIDCHTRNEAMGDGNIHGNKKEAQYVRCYTCHGTLTSLPLTKTIQESDDLALRLAFLNPVIDLKIGDRILVTERGEPLWNTRQLPNGRYELFGKSTGQRFTFQPVALTDCQQNPEQQESRFCHTCHAVER